MDHVVAKVLIDNGSSLNVMPKTTLEKLPFNASRLKPSSIVVRAFDGSQREVMGEIDIPIQIGPYTCNVVFQVMDINPFDASPEIEIRGWWTLGDSVGRRGYVGKLPLLSTICRGSGGIIGNSFPILRGGELCLCGNKSVAALSL